MKYQIRYSGVGDLIEALDWEDVEAKSLQSAHYQAYVLACEEFYSYEGLHGLGMTWDEYFEKFPGGTETDYYNFMAEECENWVSYEARWAK